MDELRLRSAYEGRLPRPRGASNSADVVLLDIGLPGLDGYEVARRLRTMPLDGADGGEPFRGRIIAVTGYGRDTDIVRAREAGFDAHLVKPYAFDELEKLLTPARK